MLKTGKRSRCLALFGLGFLCVPSSFLLAQESWETENVAAFARLYGVVRFFYPSDAAAGIDWNRLAVEGTARVRTAPDASALADGLRALFTPLGPGIEISNELATYAMPASTSAPLVAWRYLGAGATERAGGGPYAAKRTNRTRTDNPAATGFAGFAQSIRADRLQAKKVRLRGMIRTTSLDGSGGGALWLRVDRAQSFACGDNMHDRLVRDASWREYFLECEVADDATSVLFGVMIVGATAADFDGIELSVPAGDGTWHAFPIDDGGFEAESAAAWDRIGTQDAQVTHLTDAAPEGRQFVRFAPSNHPPPAEELFPEAPPTVGDHVDVDLGSGLKARVQLALTDTQARSGTADTDSTRPATSDLDARLADVVVAWNFYRHFYPYFGDVDVDWDALLMPQLQRALAATDRTGEAEALKRLVADARDGHGHVNDLRQTTSLGALPLRLALIESRVVVVASATADIAVGSVMSAIDGVPALDRFSAAMQVVSGSEQWRQVRAANEIAVCATGTTSRLGIEAAGSSRTVEVPCAADELEMLEQRPAQIAELSPGVWYVDLTRAKTADVLPVIDTLAAAKGVVFDVRGYPTDLGAWLLQHLIDAPETDRWMHVAKITGPFGRSAGWRDIGWDLEPAAPKLAGRIVFLTDARAISYAESVMAYVGDRHLATIVGSATAGANGNIARVRLPGEFGIIFTGMRVTGHDGRTVQHLVGVRPDIPVTPTIAGIREGRDEVLARALSLIQEQ